MALNRASSSPFLPFQLVVLPISLSKCLEMKAALQEAFNAFWRHSSMRRGACAVAVLQGTSYDINKHMESSRRGDGNQSSEGNKSGKGTKISGSTYVESDAAQQPDNRCHR